ncbi:hypothetical protein KUD97_10430 [Desulfovibrio desulfuricans]|uniref:dCTP deaminase domain-containing protein n=1 Tax=Desulfovibrio desulfuricans TaxID=876 RepID=UPI001F23BCD0|nr:hypothetical protein [Desulfovibrio desulfuricans]UIA99374.1 hypothetical protein KUD97_10430 [Desulfovibrio desulfuricans]
MPGTLTDLEIIDNVKEKKLIVENYEEKKVKQACYELRASNIYYDIYNQNRRCVLNEGEYILIKPKQCLVIITLESLELPANFLGRILTKGKLFSIGISAVNTYADPGFEGRLGIVLINLSNSYIKIYPGQPIAKIEFSKLSSNVSKPYRGQHGYETEVWPIPTEMLLTDEEIKNDKRIKSDIEEIADAYGENLASYMRRVFDYERTLMIFSFIAMGIILISFLFVDMVKFSDSFIDKLIAAGVGITTSIIGSIIIFFATKRKI